VPPAATTAAAERLRRGITMGFYDPTVVAPAALDSDIDHLTDLAPLWFQLGADGSLQAHPDRALVTFAHRHGVRVLPVLQNFLDGTVRADLLQGLAAPEVRRAWIDAVLTAVESVGADGVSIDLEQLPGGLTDGYSTFVADMSGRMHGIGRKVVVDLPVQDDVYDVAALASAADYILLIAYDEHFGRSAPGPIASPPWVRAALDRLAATVPPQRIILGVGEYGYDWTPDGGTGLSYGGALDRVGDPRAIQWEESSPWYTYRDSRGQDHIVYFSDAASTEPLLVEAGKAQVAGVGMWRIGSEDPGVWQLMGRDAGRIPPGALDAVIGSPPQIGDLGIASRPGERQIIWDQDGSVIGERYLALPFSNRTLLSGRVIGSDSGLLPGTVALTFDDGPDPVWTPRILDILHRHGARATFFVVGREAAQQPGLLERIYAEGHEIGNHTYTHSPDVESTSDWHFSTELGATQRIIEGVTGHSATFFRFPFTGVSPHPYGVKAGLLVLATRLGYRVVGAGADTHDWEQPGIPSIISAALAHPDGDVIMLHDGGGDRSQTVAALPAILDELQREHLKVVPLGEALGQSRDEAMPPVSWSSVLLGRVLLSGAWLLGHGAMLLQLLLGITLVLVLGRMLALGGLGVAGWLRGSARRKPTYEGPVSVVIAAHNEEAVIGDTLQALLRSEYPQMEVIVVDDGSDDATADVVRCFADCVRLVSQPQMGKATALRNGFAHARHPVVVTLDADTLFTTTTIRELVAPMADPRTAAVSGNVKVGNRVNLLTRLQGLEYLLTLNLERRAYAALNCIPIVPGAVSCWRRRAVEEVGGFTADTMAEDTDLTLALRRAGHVIAYAPSAVAYTEAPQTVRGLVRQRTRWSFGTLQCLWKHRRAMLAPRTGSLGMIALPSMWLSLILLSTLSPMLDLGVVVSPWMPWRWRILVAVAAYNAFLLAFGVWALAVDGEPVRRALLIPLQNVLYRQLTYAMAMKSVVLALRGLRVGWSRAERFNSARVEVPSKERAQLLVGRAFPAVITVSLDEAAAASMKTRSQAKASRAALEE